MGEVQCAVGCRCSHRTCDQRRLVDIPAAPDVDEDAVGAHCSDGGRVDEVVRLGRVRQGHDHIIAGCHQVAQLVWCVDLRRMHTAMMHTASSLQGRQPESALHCAMPEPVVHMRHLAG